MTKKLKFIIPILSFLGIILVTNHVLAADFGLGLVGKGLAGSLSATDPRILAGKIIQIALSFLGIIAVVIIMYAGVLWMTSEGDEEKINKSKKILRDAVIGLVIILSSWAITTFLINRFSAAMNGGSVNNANNSNNVGFSNPGVGTIGSCSVLSTYPTNNQRDVARNTSLIITFRSKIKLDTVCVDASGSSCACNNSSCSKINPVAIRLYKTDLGDVCSAISCPSINSNETNIVVHVSSDDKTLTLTPLDYLGKTNGNTPYSVKFTNVIKKLDNSSMFSNCGVDFVSWNFIVNNKIDLSPPIVVVSGMSPPPDNLRDIIGQATPAQAAQASITVNSKPQIYSPAHVLSITPTGASAILDYHGKIMNFKITVPSANTAQLFDANNNPLAVANFDSKGQVVFPNFMKFIATNHPVGSLWELKISLEKLADNLVIDSNVYTFASSSVNNNILVPNNFKAQALAANIEAKISGNPAILVGLKGASVQLTARVAGQNGNNITLTTTNKKAISIKSFSGGVNQVKLDKVQDHQDRPLNTVIQLNFNKAINPLLVSGSADQVAKSIRIVNADASSSPNGMACSSNQQCQSYKCSNQVCVGDYLAGNFMISNGYKTVEFTSNEECGINACGEKIYCLPADSHLAVKLIAADLKTCQSNNDCLTDGAFNICSSTALSYKTCQNSVGQNYPQANIDKLDGIVDASLNSLDGNRDHQAEGPISFYDDNYSTSSPQNIGHQDKYLYSFYVGHKLDLTPPYITKILPTQDQSNLDLNSPINIYFNKLMMNSTLRTGDVKVTNGTTIVEHHLINLKSISPTPFGYWISAENKDTPPYDGQPDMTVVHISHSSLAQSATFEAQVGSGVKDIYQNCYKPSAGPNCTVSSEQPSCCFGIATSSLGINGNCQ